MYRRYHIEVEQAPDRHPRPPRFRVRVKRRRLIGLVLKELVEFRGNLEVALSRPCVYGVFGGPIGGLAPREHLCVGCLRCTVEHPEIVQIHPNPERALLGDSYIHPDQVDTIHYEAGTGRVPVRGAGYRGEFGGDGWDGIWTDMSEIVRPTRDGIHGREYISTLCDIGAKPPYLRFTESGLLRDPEPRVFSIEVPFLFDLPPVAVRDESLYRATAEAARRIGSLVVLPAAYATRIPASPHIAPLVASDDELPRGWGDQGLQMLLLDGWDRGRFEAVKQRFPSVVIGVRLPADADVVRVAGEGARVLHLLANYHGRSGALFFGDRILQIHRKLVDLGVREEITLIGSGGISAAEHVPKAILCGLDVVGLDTALLVALQGRFLGECREPGTAAIHLPRLDQAWAAQRLMNLAASWRDQLLEILGAMGLREVRRLRGETGRAMFQRDIEREAFVGIAGYDG